MVPRAASRAWRGVRRHPLVAGGLLLVAVFLAGIAIDLVRVRSEIERGQDALTSLSVDQLDGDLVRTIRGATGHLDRADQIADRSPFLAVVGAIPGADTQVEGLRTLTAAAADLGAGARQAAEAIDQDLEDASREPPARLRLLDTIAEQLDRIEEVAASLDLGEDEHLSGPLGDARAEMRAELDRLPERFDEARTRVRALQRALKGPTRYLVLAGNNAEMRGGAGMPLSGGVLTVQDGDLDFGEFEPTANRWANPIDPAIVPAQYLKTYDQFRVGQSWLQTAVSPNFAAIAPVYDAMSSAFPPFGPVDGVLVVDTVMLRHLLGVIGPVEVDGVEYTAENVEPLLLNESYLGFDRSDEEREVRRDEQGKVATEIFDALKSRDVSIAALSDALRLAASERHLLAYTEDRDVQDMFDDIGASGELFGQGLMVTVQNIAADKLDWYIDPSVTIRSVPMEGRDAWNVRLTVEVPNPERSGDTAGVESYKEGYDDGVHRALVAVYLPRAAYDIRTLDVPFSEAGRDGPMKMVGKRIFIDEGDTGRVAIEFKLPTEVGGVVLMPSARVRPVTVTVNGYTTDDGTYRFLGLDPPEAEDPVPAAPVIAAFLAVAGAGALALAHRRRRVGSRPLVAPSPLELRLPSLGLVLLAAAGATLVVFAAVDAFRPR